MLNFKTGRKTASAAVALVLILMVLHLSAALAEAAAPPGVLSPNGPAGQTVPEEMPTEAVRSVERALRLQLDELDLDNLESFINQVDKDVDRFFPELSVSGILSDLRNGSLQLSFRGLTSSLLLYFFREVVAGSGLMGQLLIIAVVCAVLQNLQSAFSANSTAKLAYMVTYLALMTLAMGSFTMAVGAARQAVEQMIGFIQALFPVLLALLTAVGSISSAALLHPVVLGATGVLGTIIKNVLFPLIFLHAIIGIVGKLNERFMLDRLAGLLKDGSLAVLGVIMILFIGVLTLNGLGGAVGDAVTLRTAKFLTSSFVPVVGKMLADSLETVAGTSLLIKDAIGIFGVLGMFFLTALPALKIAALLLIYRLAAALVEPFSESPIGDALQTMANSLTLVLGVVIITGLMFFIAISVIVGLGSLGIMLR